MDHSHAVGYLAGLVYDKGGYIIAVYTTRKRDHVSHDTLVRCSGFTKELLPKSAGLHL